ncbi:MAG: hypothetical protein HN939_02525, partial [Euryarchaeota archaeon]|nr:hypothetical protein [Euryarchaeota archaeon]
MVAVMMTVLASPIVSADSAVELDSIISRENDLGIQGIAENPEGNRILIYGAEGYAEIIFADRPEIRIPLSATDKQTMRDADWHPSG